ncbi:MAG: putative oxidoreductase [Pantoea agglomerans]|jgi:quinol monooxygenase YgiN|nr:putative oxidoreductase [Pantoea agglomerans]
MIALIVSVQVHEDKLEKFLKAIETNARATFNDEPGCQYFDVTQDLKDPLHFVFYELYNDEAAVDAHREAPHFAEWRKAADECVVKGSQVNTLSHRLFSHQ